MPRHPAWKELWGQIDSWRIGQAGRDISLLRVKRGSAKVKCYLKPRHQPCRLWPRHSRKDAYNDLYKFLQVKCEKKHQYEYIILHSRSSRTRSKTYHSVKCWR